MAKRIEFINFEEFQKLYKACKDKELKLAMLLGFGSGLRISEIVGYKRITKRRKNKDTGEVVFTKEDTSIPALTPDRINLQTHQIRIDEGKGGKWRITTTSPGLTQAMVDMLPLKVKRRTLQYQFDMLVKKVLGKRMSFHILRHGFGNYQVNVLKLPLPVVQSFMGHSRLDTTGIYTKANPDEAVKMAWKAMGGE